MLIKCKSLWNTFKEVHVLVFGDDASGTGTHGVHSLWTCKGDRCYNTVVAFAQLEDAHKCAVLSLCRCPPFDTAATLTFAALIRLQSSKRSQYQE
jgi:hypothetical protein